MKRRYGDGASARLFTSGTGTSYPSTDNVTWTNLAFPANYEAHLVIRIVS